MDYPNLRLGTRLAVAAATITLAGCGGSSHPGSSHSRLSITNEVRVAHANVDLSQFCLDELQTGSVPVSETDRAINALRTLIDIFRAQPTAVFQPGGKGPAPTMREVLSDRASALDSCDPEGAHTLDRALSAG